MSDGMETVNLIEKVLDYECSVDDAITIETMMFKNMGAEIKRLTAELAERDEQLLQMQNAAIDLTKQLADDKAELEYTKEMANAFMDERNNLRSQLAEARAENEKIGSVLGLHEYTKRIRKEAAKECYNLVNTFATPDIVFVLDAIKAKFGLEG